MITLSVQRKKTVQYEQRTMIIRRFTNLYQLSRTFCSREFVWPRHSHRCFRRTAHERRPNHSIFQLTLPSSLRNALETFPIAESCTRSRRSQSIEEKEKLAPRIYLNIESSITHFQNFQKYFLRAARLWTMPKQTRKVCTSLSLIKSRIQSL